MKKKREIGCEAHHYRPGDYKEQPWKNGLGTTREIACDPEQPFRWRISASQIPSTSPFSAYAGYERTLVILSGGPVALKHEGRPSRILARLDPYRFSGDWDTTAETKQPANDFNVFALTGRAKVSVYPASFRLSEELQFPLNGHEHFLYGVDGEMEVLESNLNRHFVLKAHETIRVTRKPPQELLNLRAQGKTPQAGCLWVVVHLL